MPSHSVGDAFYGCIVGITNSRTKHPLLPWKISEQPLVSIVVNVPPILQCLDGNIKCLIDNMNNIAILLPPPLKLLKQ